MVQKLIAYLRADKKRGLGLAILILLLIIAVLWSFVHKTVSPDKAESTTPTFDVSVDGNAASGNKAVGKEDIQEELNRQVEEGMIQISMNMRPVFETGESAGNLLIYNDEANRHMQVVEIYRSDTGELIYRSGGIPVGSGIESAALDVSLPTGTYPCTAYFNAVDESSGALLGKAGAQIEITVQN